MKIVVQKFGGTSVKDDEARHTAMKHVAYAVKKGFKAAVVVSEIGRIGVGRRTRRGLDKEVFQVMISRQLYYI